jgi:hypothetical protein
MEVSGQLHTPAALPLGKIAPYTHWTGSLVGPSVNLDAVEEEKPFCTAGNRAQAVHPVARRYIPTLP